MARSLVTVLCFCAALAVVACHEQGDITIASLTVEGVKSVKESRLRDVLQTRRGSRIPWGRERYFDRRAFEADLQRIQTFYRDRGFPDARVASFDVKLNDAQDQVDLTVTIAEGEPVRVAEIRFDGFDVLPDKERRTLQDGLPLQAEQPLDRQLALAARDRAVNLLRDHGYAYADVRLEEEEVGPKRNRLTLRAAPGPIAHFGLIEVVGPESVDEEVVRRQLTYKPGELFKRSEMRESQRKLYGLELFEFVNIDSQEDKTSRLTEVPTRVTVAETKHQKVTFGVGYGTEEQARARVRWDHLNFLGGARHAGFEGKWSSLDRGARMDYTEPYFFGPHFSLRFDGQAWQAVEPVYRLNSVGGGVTMRHKANSRDEWSVALINEYQRSRITNDALEDFTLRDELISLGLDPRTGQHEGTLSAVAFDIRRTTTTNLLDARRGYVLSARAEQAGRWLWGNFNYYQLTAEARHYLPIARTVVVANRLRVGSIDGLGEDLESSVPFYKRYFLGGASSVRGWGRFEVSPLSGFGLPIGGHSMLEGSSELRVPVVGKFGAVAFVDYGNVWSGSYGYDLGNLRYAVGPGLRYLTPVGPARIDVGWQVNPTPELLVNGKTQPRRWRVHFSIGQAF